MVKYSSVLCLLLGALTFQAEAADEGKAGRATGIVLDAAGKRAAGAEVLIYSGRTFERKVTAGKDGAYEIKDLPRGKYHLKARMGKMFTKRLSRYDIRVSDGAQVKVNLKLVAGGKVHVKVINKKSGKPVAGASVWLDDDDSGKKTTDKKGTAIIAGFDYDRVDFQVEAEGYAKMGRYHRHHADTEPGKTTTTTVEMEPERFITGSVVNEKQEPLTDAVVTIESRWEGRWGGMGADWDPDITNEKGHFRLGGLDGGTYTYRLKATKEGFAPGRANVGSGPKAVMSGVTIVLHRGATLEGTVRNEKGEPLAEATVMLGDDVSTLSDSQGKWMLEHVEKGEYKLVAENKTLRSREKKLDVGWADHFKSIDLVLKKKDKEAFAVSGIVVDAVNGKPIENVRLRFWNLSRLGERTTGKDGKFLFKEIPIHRSRRIYFKGCPEPYIEPVQKIEFPVEDRDIKDLVIRMPRGASIAGRVLLPDGEGAWEAKIRFVHPDYTRTGRLRRMKVSADSDGYFKAAGIPHGIGWRVRVELDGYPPAFSAPLNLRQGDRVAGIKLQLKKPGSLSGSIKTPDGGKPGKKCFVVAKVPGFEDSAWNNSWLSGRVEPDEKGDFKMTNLPPGEVAVQLWREVEGYGGGTGWSSVDNLKKVRIVSGKETRNVAFILDEGDAGKDTKKPDGYISGRVVSIADDEGIAGLDVYARSNGLRRGKGAYGSTKTGPDGSFRIEGLARGMFELRVNYSQKSGYDEQMLSDIESPSEDIPVVLRRLCVIEGRVIEKRTGKPVPAFSICDVGSKESNIRDPEGRFRLENLQRGECLLRVVSESGAVAQRCIELQEGEHVRDVVLALHEPWRVSGRVVRESDGKAVAGAIVKAFSLERKDPSGVKTDADGRFSIEGVYPGMETLKIEHPEFGKPWFPDIAIPESLDQQETIVKLKEPGTVRGRVLYEKGLPYEGVEVCLEIGEGGYSRLFRETRTTGYDGDYAFESVPPGQYTVVWRGRHPEQGSGGHWSQTIDVKPGKTTIVDFGKGDAVITGVTTDKGKTKRLVVLNFARKKLKRWVQTDNEGKYRIYGLEAGTYHFTLYLPGTKEKILFERDIRVPARGELKLDFDISKGKK